MKVIYRADDGKEFDDEFECTDYEWKLKHPHIKDIHLYDGDGNELSNIFSEDTYSNVEKLVVPDKQAAKELQELGKYTGFTCYEWIDDAGTWVCDDSKFVKAG